MTTEQPSKAKRFLGTILTGAAAVGAFIVAQSAEQLGQMGGAWLGGALFFPLVIVFLCYWAAKRLLPPGLEDLRLAIAIVSGQALSFLMAGLFLGAVGHVLLDVIILVAGLAWLIARPGIWPIAFLIGVEGFALLINLFMLTQVDFEAGLKGILSSLFIRVAAIFFLYTGLSSRRAAAQSSTLPLEQSETPNRPA